MPVPSTRQRHIVGATVDDTDDGSFRGIIRYIGVHDHALSVADQASATTAYRIGFAGVSTELTQIC